MNKLVLAVLVISTPAVASGENNAIEKTNYEVGISGTNEEHVNRYEISGEARTSIAPYTGASLNVGRSSFQGKDNYVDSDTTSVGAGVFLRKQELGTIGARYSHSLSEPDVPYPIASKYRIDGYGLYGDYYLEDFDISASRLIAKPEQGNSLHSWTITGGYYVSNNLVAKLSAGGMDSKDNYSFGVAYQPELLKNAASLTIGYYDTPNDNSLSLSISYFFDTRVNLKERNRRY